MAATSSKLRKKVDWFLYRAEAMLLSEGSRSGVAAHLKPEEALARLPALIREASDLELGPRQSALQATLADEGARERYLEQYGCVGIWRFAAGADTRIYRLRVETFPRHVNNVVLIIDPDHVVLFDVGSGFAGSTRDIELGFAVVREVFGEDVRLDQVDTLVISHAHIDHFGGVHDLRRRSNAAVCVHELDARVLCNFEERVVVATKDVDVYLRRAGVPDQVRTDMLRLYGASRNWFKSISVDRRLRDGDEVGSGHQVIHVPGHCPGLICLRVRDVLLASDHILARITPHQFPQQLSTFGGLERYLESLDKIRRLEGIAVTIGGHEEPIFDLPTRIGEIAAFHDQRLDALMQIFEQPTTLYEATREMFGDHEDYGRILAVEEAGAHVEYLHLRGRIKIANLDEVEVADDPVIRYVAAS